MMFSSLAYSAIGKSHYIALNVYMVENGQLFPLYETQKIQKKCYELMSIQDEILMKYKTNFYDIKYIEVFASNIINKQEKIVIGFTNKKKKKKIYYTNNFFHFTTPYKPSSDKIFSYQYLADLKINLETVPVADKDNSNLEYAKISKINY